jgi:hypothetical protein
MNVGTAAVISILLSVTLFAFFFVSRDGLSELNPLVCGRHVIKIGTVYFCSLFPVHYTKYYLTLTSKSNAVYTIFFIKQYFLYEMLHVSTYYLTLTSKSNAVYTNFFYKTVFFV